MFSLTNLAGDIKITTMKPQLIAFDLDNTFLDSDKKIPQENMDAIEQAYREGAFIVPATGRFPGGLPDEFADIPIIRYLITINGAVVFDRETNDVLYRAAIPLERTLAVMHFLAAQDVIYDSYMETKAFMTRALWEKADRYIESPYYRERVKALRTPVDSLPDFIREQGRGVSKIQMFTNDMALRARLLEELPQRFPQLSVSTSLPDNIEITDENAHKGLALEKLAAILHVPMERTFAIGDGTNDLTMLRMAGHGVAMGNAEEAVRAAADEVTTDCDHGGFARAVLRALG